MWSLANRRKSREQKKSFLVIGLGYFGEAVATSLYDMGMEVVGVDNDPEIVQRLADKLTQAIELDATDEEALSTLGVRNFDVCIVGRGSDLEDSVMVTMNLKEQGANFIVAKAMRAKHARILEQMKTDLIVFPEIDMAHQLAENLVNPKVIGKVDLGNGYVAEAIQPSDFYVGRNLGNLDKHLPEGIKFVGLRKGNELITTLDDSINIDKEDLLLLWGVSEKIAEMGR